MNNYFILLPIEILELIIVKIDSISIYNFIKFCILYHEILYLKLFNINWGIVFKYKVNNNIDYIYYKKYIYKNNISYINYLSYIINEELSKIKIVLPIHTINDMIICDDDKRHSINLFHCNMFDIPTQFYLFTNLTVLKLTHNNIETIPDEISKLKNLNTLDISYNYIISISEHITRLKCLQDLNISNNILGIQSLEVVFNCNTLKYLYLNNCNIYSLTGINKLINLITLNISKNTFNNLMYDDLKGLDTLNSLDISHNYLRILPPDFILNLKNLKKLDIVCCDINYFNESMSTLNTIEIIICKNEYSNIEMKLKQIKKNIPNLQFVII
jgi:hypothetical protein